MGTQTGISWTDHTFNPWWGCVRVSPGCEHCYAETFSKRVGHKVWGVQAERRFFGNDHWYQPIKWNAAAEREGVRHRVFCASMADVFEDRVDLVTHRERLFRLIEDTPMLDWQLLTKRPENITRIAGTQPMASNIWIGATVEDRKRKDRIDSLACVRASRRFLSLEPLIEDPLIQAADLENIDWIIIGGESGNGARPFDLAWARRLIAVARTAGVWVFVKQLGANVVETTSNENCYLPREMCPGPTHVRGVTLRQSKGDDPSEWPEDLRVQEFPV